MKKLCAYILTFMCVTVTAQQPTLNQRNTTSREAAASHKALIIPFEPRLYMGEVDHHINAETRLSAKEIKHKFRDGLNEQLYRALKNSNYNAVDLMEDTARYRKDITQIYQYLSYDYMRVPDQKNYKAPQREKEEKKIEKGQLRVETDGERRFMNAKMTNPKLLTNLKEKYKTDVFIFINQLDIKASGSKDPLDLGPENTNRRITVHYTVFSSDGKEINSGVAEEEFAPDLNNPRKIIDKHFAVLSTMIVQRVNKALLSSVK